MGNSELHNQGWGTAAPTTFPRGSPLSGDVRRYPGQTGDFWDEKHLDAQVPSESESHSVMSSSFQPHGLYSPWNSPGQNTEVCSLSLPQGIFPTQGSNPGVLHCRQILCPPMNSRFGFRERRGGARGSGSVYRAGMVYWVSQCLKDGWGQMWETDLGQSFVIRIESV